MISQVGLEGNKEVSDTEILSDFWYKWQNGLWQFDSWYRAPVTLWLIEDSIAGMTVNVLVYHIMDYQFDLSGTAHKETHSVPTL